MMADPRNRSVALLSVILLPDDDEHVLMVMPMLLRFDILPFRRFGEFAEAIHQFLQVNANSASRYTICPQVVFSGA